MKHYKVEIGNDGRVFYCDTWPKVFAWLNTMLQQDFTRYADIQSYNKGRERDLIDIYRITIPISEFYERRQTYMNAVNHCDILLERARRTTNPKRRSTLLSIFHRYYELANDIWQNHPQVWMGEI